MSSHTNRGYFDDEEDCSGWRYSQLFNVNQVWNRSSSLLPHIPLKEPVPPTTDFHENHFTPTMKSAGSHHQDSKHTTTILLVEDEEILRSLVEGFLKEKGFHVLSVQNGLEAVRLYRQHGENIGVVFTDLHLPMLNGFDLFLRMKELNPGVRVIFASGHFDPTIKTKLRQAGVQHFVEKPYAPDEVFHKIVEVLRAG